MKITKETVINYEDTIYNPIEDVHYCVHAYMYDIDYATKLAYLETITTSGSPRKRFTITIEDMIKLNYELIKRIKKEP